MRALIEDERWQESWDKMEETEHRERDIGEADEEVFERQDREDKGLAHLEERRRREPPIGDPCSHCHGEGVCGLDCTDPQPDCPHCQGTGVV